MKENKMLGFVEGRSVGWIGEQHSFRHWAICEPHVGSVPSFFIAMQSSDVGCEFMQATNRKRITFIHEIYETKS